MAGLPFFQSTIVKENDARKRISGRGARVLLIAVPLLLASWGLISWSKGLPNNASHLEDSIVSFYKNLHSDELSRRDSTSVESLAIHRPLGRSNSTKEHYELIAEQLLLSDDGNSQRRIIADAGCGLGAGLVWFEQHHETQWKLEGYNVSPTHVEYIQKKLLPNHHHFQIYQQSYDDLVSENYDGIYSIEALVHSPDYQVTLSKWYKKLKPGGRVVLIDDYLTNDEDDSLAQSSSLPNQFRNAWRIPSLTSASHFLQAAKRIGYTIRVARDLTKDYEIPKYNYPGPLPKEDDLLRSNLSPPWIGAKVRHLLTVTGRIQYMMYVLEKPV